MREIRQSGSEGGGGNSPYPYPLLGVMGSKGLGPLAGFQGAAPLGRGSG
jgi:hypothetical protein